MNTATLTHVTRTSKLIDDQRVAGLGFLAIGAGFMTVIMLAASLVPDYAYADAAISDLGITPGSATLFNLSLVAVGLVNLLAGFVFYRGHGRLWLLALYVIAGLGAVGAGVFPLDTGAPHSLSALIAFLFFNLEAIGTAAVLRGPIRWISVASGALGLVFVVLMVIGDSGNAAAFGPIGHGGTERMIVYPVMVWLVALGGYLLAQVDERRADDVP
jgi:hypothetical membrane protein